MATGVATLRRVCALIPTCWLCLCGRRVPGHSWQLLFRTPSRESRTTPRYLSQRDCGIHEDYHDECRHRKHGDVLQREVMTMQDQVQMLSKPKLCRTRNLDHKKQAPITANELSRDSGQPRCGGVVVLLVGLDGSCTPARLES